MALFLRAVKSTTAFEFLKHFLFEYSQSTIRIYLRIIIIICDAQARAFVEGIKGHETYNGCDSCVTKGEHFGKVVFPELDATLVSNMS